MHSTFVLSVVLAFQVCAPIHQVLCRDCPYELNLVIDEMTYQLNEVNYAKGSCREPIFNDALGHDSCKIVAQVCPQVLSGSTPSKEDLKQRVIECRKGKLHPFDEEWYIIKEKEPLVAPPRSKKKPWKVKAMHLDNYKSGSTILLFVFLGVLLDGPKLPETSLSGYLLLKQPHSPGPPGTFVNYTGTPQKSIDGPDSETMARYVNFTNDIDKEGKAEGYVGQKKSSYVGVRLSWDVFQNCSASKKSGKSKALLTAGVCLASGALIILVCLICYNKAIKPCSTHIKKARKHKHLRKEGSESEIMCRDDVSVSSETEFYGETHTEPKNRKEAVTVYEFKHYTSTVV